VKWARPKGDVKILYRPISTVGSRSAPKSVECIMCENGYKPIKRYFFTAPVVKIPLRPELGVFKRKRNVPMLCDEGSDMYKKIQEAKR